MNYENYCAVLEHIEQHPEEWNQHDWCGASCCFAGHAIRMFGIVPETGSGCFLRSGRDVLELTQTESWWLFEGDRTLDDFRRVRLVAGRTNFPA